MWDCAQSCPTGYVTPHSYGRRPVSAYRRAGQAGRAGQVDARSPPPPRDPDELQRIDDSPEGTGVHVRIRLRACAEAPGTDKTRTVPVRRLLGFGITVIVIGAGSPGGATDSRGGSDDSPGSRSPGSAGSADAAPTGAANRRRPCLRWGRTRAAPAGRAWADRPTGSDRPGTPSLGGSARSDATLSARTPQHGKCVSYPTGASCPVADRRMVAGVPSAGPLYRRQPTSCRKRSGASTGWSSASPATPATACS